MTDRWVAAVSAAATFALIIIVALRNITTKGRIAP